MSVGVDGSIGMLPRTSIVPGSRHHAGCSEERSGRRRMPPEISASSSGLSGRGAVGEYELTRIPYGARSIAAARVKLASPPLWNAYAITPAHPCQAFEDGMLTIEPFIPRSI